MKLGNNTLTENGRTSRLSSQFCRISNYKNFIPKYLNNALTDFASTLQTSRRLLKKEVPVSDFGEQFPMPRNTAVSKIGNGVLTLL